MQHTQMIHRKYSGFLKNISKAFDYETLILVLNSMLVFIVLQRPVKFCGPSSRWFGM